MHQKTNPLVDIFSAISKNFSAAYQRYLSLQAQFDPPLKTFEPTVYKPKIIQPKKARRTSQAYQQEMMTEGGYLYNVRSFLEATETDKPGLYHLCQIQFRKETIPYQSRSYAYKETIPFKDLRGNLRVFTSDELDAEFADFVLKNDALCEGDHSHRGYRHKQRISNPQPY